MSKREGQILFVCIFIILVYVGYNFIFKSFQEEVQLLQKRITATEARLSKNYKILTQKRAIDSEFEKLSVRLKQKRSEIGRAHV